MPSRALRRVRLTFDPTPQTRAASFITWMWRVVMQSGGRKRGRERRERVRRVTESGLMYVL